MNYTKFFNSNPSVSGNNAMSNIEALAKFDAWLAGQEIIDISVGESQDTYTPLTFTKENGDTYTVNIPTVKGDTGAQGPKGDTGAQGPIGETGPQGPKGDTGLEALSIIKVYESATTPSVNSEVTINVSDFNRTPTTNEQAIMFVTTNDCTGESTAYITEITVNTITDTTVNCIYNSVNKISTNPNISSFNYVGKWVSENQYHKNDCVYYTANGYNVNAYYICIEDTNSFVNPGSDTTHWAVIGTNTNSYKEGGGTYDNLDISESGNFKLSETSYIHFVTLSDTRGSVTINAFCITNSPSEPTIEEFNEFLDKVSSPYGYYIMASGSTRTGTKVLSIITGISCINNTIYTQTYSLSS